MASTGNIYPGTLTEVAPGDNTWVDLANAKTVSDDVATCSLDGVSTAFWLHATNFGFTIPAGATINGIVVGHKTSEDVDVDGEVNSVQIIVGGSRVGTPKTTGDITTTLTTRASGTVSDLWGLTPTRDQVVATDFGVALQLRNWTAGGLGNVNVAYIRMDITYTAASGVTYGFHTVL
jgi:hypothetical protein